MESETQFALTLILPGCLVAICFNSFKDRGFEPFFFRRVSLKLLDTASVLWVHKGCWGVELWNPSVHVASIGHAWEHRRQALISDFNLNPSCAWMLRSLTPDKPQSQFMQHFAQSALSRHGAKPECFRRGILLVSSVMLQEGDERTSGLTSPDLAVPRQKLAAKIDPSGQDDASGCAAMDQTKGYAVITC